MRKIMQYLSVRMVRTIRPKVGQAEKSKHRYLRLEDFFFVRHWCMSADAVIEYEVCFRNRRGIELCILLRFSDSEKRKLVGIRLKQHRGNEMLSRPVLFGERIISFHDGYADISVRFGGRILRCFGIDPHFADRGVGMNVSL